MGVGYTAYVFVGMKLDENKLYRTKRARGCGHLETIGRFCGTCGKPMWKELRSFLPTVDCPYADTVECSLSEIRSVAGLKLVLGTSYGNGEYESVFVAGAEVMRVVDNDKLPVLDLAEVRGNMRRVLEPVGLWDDDAFGVWCVLHCSY